MTGTRRIVANLDAEEELAAHLFGRRPRTLNRVTREVLASAGTLLRAFAADGDRLWTVAPVAPERIPTVAGLPAVRLESGPRVDRPGEPEPWSWMASTPLVARVADRAWGLALSTRLGFALAGARPVASVADLDAAVAALEGRPWIVKAAFSAAGRDRLRARAGAERFFRRHGHGAFEPWLERLADFGAAGEVDGVGKTHLLGLHRLEVDTGGRFQGITLGVGAPHDAPGLARDEAAQLAAALAAAGEALATEGFRGPFGLDAFRYRDRDGTIAFHPWVELNPRLTFGRVARQLVNRVAAAQGWPPGTTVRFGLGRRVPPGALVLLAPAAAAPGAWLIPT